MNYSKALIQISLLFVTLMITACNDDKITIFLDGVAERKLDDVYQAALSDPDIINLAISVESPKQNFAWSKAGGVAYPETGEMMTTQTPFRIASVGKTFTATLIMQIIEAGNITLSTPIADILTDDDMPEGFTLDELHQLEGISSGSSLTIHQLLNHTSGLRDYIADEPDNKADSYSLIALLILDVMGIQPSGLAKKNWTSNSILQYFFSSGMNQHAMKTPGKSYHYSDTNYVLLGLIIEKLSGMSLANNYRSEIFSHSQMHSAYLDWYEATIGSGPAHHYSNLLSYGINENIDIIDSNINTSFDWAGGGIVCSIEELNNYVKALFNNQLFNDTQTLKNMQQTAVGQNNSSSYGLGLQKKEYKLFNETVVVYGHEGAWGVGMYYIPATDTSIVYTINQASIQNKDWLWEIIKGLDKAFLFTAIK